MSLPLNQAPFQLIAYSEFVFMDHAANAWLAAMKKSPHA
jgi:hypothetical protein